MSLLKQLLASVTIVIICILVGALAVSIDSARRYLSAQMQSQSDNAAATLALLLSQPASQDPAIRELLVSALYDNSQLLAIRLTRVDGTILYEKRRDAGSSGPVSAPAWFRRWLPLGPVTSIRTVSDGWKQVGELAVDVGDVYASETLWRSSVRLLWLVSILGVLWALCAVLLVRAFRRALVSDVAEQLGDIETGAARPSGRERLPGLSDVSRVIDDARLRVRAVEQEMTGRIDQLEVEANRDPVTGLANRRYFVHELTQVLRGSDAGNQAAGHVLMLRQCDLAAMNRIMARSEVDEWLADMADGMAAVLKGNANLQSRLARLNGADFAVLMPDSSGPQATRLAQELRIAVAQFGIDLQEGRPSRWALALTDYCPGMGAANVLAVLDHGLMRAESAGHGDIEYIVNDVSAGDRQPDVRVSGDDALPIALSTARQWNGLPAGMAGEGAWRILIIDALKEGRLVLSTTLRRYRHDETLFRHEALLMLQDRNANSAPLSGYLFMPAAVRLGLTAQCDMRAVELGLAWQGTRPGELTVRISLPSILRQGFAEDLRALLLAHSVQPGQTQRLFLEIAAHALSLYARQVEAFCQIVRAGGARVGIRGFARQPGALVHLHRMGADYIKLDREFIDGLSDSPGSLHLLVAIMKTASELGVAVLAQDVHELATSELLRRHGVYVSVS